MSKVSYELDRFTRPLMRDGVLDYENGMHYTTWTTVTAEYEVEIVHCNTMENDGFHVCISKFFDEEMDDSDIVSTVSYPTLNEAKAFVDGYLATK